MASGGNRHMGTARGHNKVHRKRAGSKGALTPTQRADLEHTIHNRGPLMNPEAQKAHGKLREEMAKLAEASAVELGNLARQLSAARTDINVLWDQLHKERTARLKLAAEQRTYVDRGDRDANMHADLGLNRFTTRDWRDRLRWIFLGH